ncbi:hypothetical protein L207DRAFT_82607 [Hyaloscypha variabilis F]|uniref:Uncharacterized protein n=1 Tax=Hyaloscypha variabilis (strain UAMH 11265 / GT02V1 / F) TaxID=1149755 RepID=A0A2J6RDA9_HYAVF|nr:hypothetical protein L207DRAFT_82607 [Hyaloscypha variabilis F]
MDARGREKSRRPSIKRPWEEDDVLPEPDNAWFGATLPPIDSLQYRRTSISTQVAEAGGNLHNIYQPNSREAGAKRVRYEGGTDYNPFPDGKLQSQASQLYNPIRRSFGTPDFQERQGGEPADTQDTAFLCRRCRRLTTQVRDLELEACEECESNPELALVTQKAAAALTKLANTLVSGISSVRRGVIRTPEHFEVSSTDCPPIAQYGLRHTLNWLLGRINHINGLADQFVQNVPPEPSPTFDRTFTRYGQSIEDGLSSIMKRRIITESDEAPKDRDDNAEPPSDAKMYTRRKSIATMMGNEDSLSRSQHEYHQASQPSIDGPSRRGSFMNPPPAPNRQLPSPPGRSLPSPTSISFPSPSAGSYGISQPLNLPTPSSLHHQPSPGGYLPPIGPSHSTDAIQAHSAALQHEVSVQKIALSSLQGEHDKLLAAFSRSQTRASALEKKHAVSDSEIISLSEEKMRLQTQVIELERDVEELSRTRDECRQAAVQEGAQYVEIVKKATQLEELAAEERKSWSKMKTEMEQTIEALRASVSTSDGAPRGAALLPLDHIIDDVDTPASSVEADLKIEAAADVGPTSYPKELQESNEELKEEIRRLRFRCAEAESSLRAVRDDSRKMEGIIEALGLAGKSIIERADRALGSVAED